MELMAHDVYNHYFCLQIQKQILKYGKTYSEKINERQRRTTDEAAVFSLHSVGFGCSLEFK